MEVIIHKSPEASSIKAAGLIANQIQSNPKTVLGLATGSTPIPLYQELIRLHEEEGLDFSQVVSFNLDEYVGLSPKHPQSYRYFMQRELFDHLNIDPSNTYVPDGQAADIPQHCLEYEAKIEDAGGIDIQILGIGSDGHIGFNEPSSSLASRTRIKTLTPRTLEDNARFFGDRLEDVPKHCITMGIGTIMEARTNLLLAFGEGKASAVAKMVEGPISAMVPASILQYHQKAKVFIDSEASSQLQLREYYNWVYAEKPEWQRND